MPPTARPPARLLMLALLTLQLAGCATVPTSSPAPAIPPLPEAARQPAPPAWCSPTCSAGWRSEVERLLQLSTPLASPERPASAPMTR